MEKFSLYDLLSVLFPGVIFMYLLDEVRNTLNLFPDFKMTEQWEILLIMAILFGAFIYVISFWLTSNLKWFYKSTKIYTHISSIYFKVRIHDVAGEKLNQRANEWYGHDIFFSETEFNSFEENKKNEIYIQQDDFYDKMYYELDYADKLAVPKSFQSFYVFFRNIFLSTIFCLIILFISYLINFIPDLNLFQLQKPEVLKLFILCLIILLCSNKISRWYRQRMVYKMYWFFYSHINSK